MAGDPLMPETLDTYIGQPLARKNIVDEIIAVQGEWRRGNSNAMPAHMLAFGPPGLGKSSLGKLLAKHLGLQTETASGANYDTASAIREVLQGFVKRAKTWKGTWNGCDYPDGYPFLWIIDEADEVKPSAAKVLHPVMTDGVFYDGGKEIALPNIAIFATTNYVASIPRAMADRFQIRVKFWHYPKEDLWLIINNSAKRLGLGITEDAIYFIAEYGAGSPRRVNHILWKGRYRGTIDRATAEELILMADLFPEGLTRLQVEILQFLSRQPKKKASLQTIANVLYEDPKDILREHERHLLAMDFIHIQGGGREITPQGERYLIGLEDWDEREL